MRLLIRCFLCLWALAIAALPASAAEEQVVNVYNWSDYITDETLQKFTAETGIKINYDVYDSNEILDAKLSAGGSGYDVVFPTGSAFFAKQIKSGIYQKLDKGKLPHWSKIDRQVLDLLAKADPGNQYGATYMQAATGIGYNLAKVGKAAPGQALDGWAMLFDPALVSKFKSCGVSLLDDSTEVFSAALAFLGHSPLLDSKAELKTAADAVAAIRPNIKYFHSSKYINDLANGDICVAHGYVGDLVQARNRAREAGAGVDIRIVIPKQGAILNVDAIAIPADAPHPDNAHKFIDFLLRPEIIAAITNKVGYANAIPESLPLVRDDVRNDPVIYMPDDIRAKLFVTALVSNEFQRERSRAWLMVKGGR